LYETLPAWSDFKPLQSRDWVEVLEWLAEDGREMGIRRMAERYGKPYKWMEYRVYGMYQKGLLDRRKGWDGWMYRPSGHGLAVAERGW